MEALASWRFSVESVGFVVWEGLGLAAIYEIPEQALDLSYHAGNKIT